MKLCVFLGLVVIGLVALSDAAYIQQDDGHQELCSGSSENGMECMDSCYERGLHGQCDRSGLCSCTTCIYSACKKHCMKQGLVAQCDDFSCTCLS